MSDVTFQTAPVNTDILQPMQAVVAEFRNECSDLESLVMAMFDDLDRMRVELERKALEIDAEKQRNCEQESRLRQQREDTERYTESLRQQEERLAGAFASLNDMREQIAHEREDSLARSHRLDEHEHKRVEELEKEANELRQQLNESLTELRLMSRSTLELAQAREQITQCQNEIMELTGQLHAATAANGDAKLLSDLERERDELRDEVELLRDRAAELSENMVSQRVEMERQREELTNELKHLRRFVEMQTEMMMTRNPNASVAATPRSSDAVTSAVMAQFSKVQRDASERRKTRPLN